MKRILRGKVLTIGLIFVIGLVWRLTGIIDNHSFWADEAFIAGMAKYVLQGKQALFSSLSIGGVNYQPLFFLTVLGSLKLFGLSELAARLPVVVLSSLGVIPTYLIAKEMSNKWGGFLAGFLYAVSYLNLAHATQAKPYTIIQMLVLVVVYLIIKDSHRFRQRYHGWMIFLLVISFLFQKIGIFFMVVYLAYIAFQYPKQILKQVQNKMVLVAGLAGAGLFVFMFKDVLLNLNKILVYNNFSYLNYFFLKQYLFFSLPAIIGWLISYKDHKVIAKAVLVFGLVYLFFWNFASYSHNIRYLMPLFSFILIYFASFWAWVGQILWPRKKWLVPAVAIVVIFISGSKIARRPQKYYNPNVDFYGDVQIADYKSMYAKLKQKFPDYQKLAIFNDLVDTEPWYLGRYSNAYFRKFVSKPVLDKERNLMVYGGLADFKKEMAKHKKGLVIIEDWVSFWPDDIKTYVKKNLKLEIKVDGLAQAQGDNWPLAVYSWGIND